MAKKKHRLPQVVLGVDVGGTGIKGALVDTKAGALVGDRYRIPTPQPATPEAVAAAVAEIAEHFKWEGRMGCTMPALVRRGTVESAINIDPSWVGTDAAALFAEATGHPASVLNDGDAAGIAEVRFGAGAGQEGTVLVLTLGTGVGSALFVDGRLVPNTEFGHLQLGGVIVEHRASNAVRKREDLSWEDWAVRVQEMLDHMDFLFSPDLIVIGGGVSRPQRWANFGHLLKSRTRLVPAALQNEAGLIGAAWAARRA